MVWDTVVSYTLLVYSRKYTGFHRENTEKNSGFPGEEPLIEQ